MLFADGSGMSDPSPSDVHVPGPLGNKPKGKGKMKKPNKAMNLLKTLATSLGFEVKKGSGLYVRRELCDVSEAMIRSWAYAVGIPNVNWGDLHITLVHSSVVVALELDPKSLDLPLTNVKLKVLEGDVLVLAFESPELTARWQAAVDAGAKWDYAEFIPHITLSINPYSYEGLPFDTSKVSYKQLPAIITLEGEEFMPAEDEDEEEVVDKSANKNALPFSISAVVVAKTEDDKQIVWGWASVVEENGVEVEDHQGDVISSEDMQKAAHDFVRNVRMGKVMHEGAYKTELVDSVFMSNDLQKALGIDLGKVGWLVGFHVPDAGVWKRVKSGDLPAFSIGGRGERTPIEE